MHMKDFSVMWKKIKANDMGQVEMIYKSALSLQLSKSDITVEQN